MKGSAGQLTFKQVNGQTIVSEKVTAVANPRTDAQMQTRTKFTNIIQMYRGIRPLLNYGFESKPKGCSDYNMFVKVNMQRTPVYLTKQQVAGGACVAAPYQFTQGSLPAIVVTGSGNGAKTDIYLGGITLGSATTVAQFAQAVVENNADYRYGDQISFFRIAQKVNEETGIPYCQFSASKVVLDAADTETKLWDAVNRVGFSAVDSVLGHSESNFVGAFGWVHSRKTDGKTLVSSQSLVAVNDGAPWLTTSLRAATDRAPRHSSCLTEKAPRAVETHLPVAETLVVAVATIASKKPDLRRLVGKQMGSKLSQ